MNKIDYSKAKIYKIVSKMGKVRYYGSTTYPLEHRLEGHKDDYQRWVMGKRGWVSSFKVVKFPDAKIILLEDYPCDNERELKDREDEWIILNRKSCCNHMTNAEAREKFRKQRYSVAFADEDKIPTN